MLCILLLCVITAQGATNYWVRTDGNNSNNGLTNSAGGAKLTIPGAAAVALAGDTIWVESGTYTGPITITRDGTLANPITYIADGAVTLTGYVELSGSDYTRWIGFTHNRNFSGTDSQDAMQVNSGATGCEVWNCTFRRFLRNGLYINACNGNLAFGNVYDGTNGTAGVDAESALAPVFGDNNLTAYSQMNRCNEDFITHAGDSNCWLNCWGWGPNTNSVAHVDFFQTSSNALGGTFNRFEANYYQDSGSAQDNHHFTNWQADGAGYHDFLCRWNVIRNTGSGTYGVFSDFSRFYFVHDGFFLAQQNSAQAGNRYCVYGGNGTTNMYVHNSGFIEGWGSSVSNPQVFSSDGTNLVANGNGAWDLSGAAAWSAPFTSQASYVTNAPLQVDFTNGDFRLTGSSPWIAVAKSVTTVSSASSSGTSFNVANSGFFQGTNVTFFPQYSGGLNLGDTILVSGNAATTILTVSGATITVAASQTWTNGAPVYLGSSATPDIGPYPLSHVPLTTAQYSISGNDYTTVPNGDTRYVVLYADGIPKGITNASPWTINYSGGGVISVYAYPRYGSTNLYISATLAASSGVLYRNRGQTTARGFSPVP